jgi:deoxyribodipyrimidine photo-lyase
MLPSFYTNVVTESVVIVWFDRDLRLSDNPALQKALGTKDAIVPVFIWAPADEGSWPPGAASRWWLHQSLLKLEAALAAHGSKLIVRRGPAAETLLKLAEETRAAGLFWNRRYEPGATARDQEIERRLRGRGIAVERYPGNVLFEPGTVLKSNSKPFQVFTAFWRACQEKTPNEPSPAPERLSSPAFWPESLAIADLDLEPRIDWVGGIREAWCPGESGAWVRMRDLFGSVLDSYSKERDRPDRPATSRLSPHIHFGEISVRQIWHEVSRHAGSRYEAVEKYLREIAWREFSYHLLFHFPHTVEEPLHPEFRAFPWRADARGFRAWTKGRMGYPIVDAGMRELWHTGWMHNRVRMVAASFLVKHLMIPWQEGAAWFWDTLVDADLANNTMGWQWTAGCGADAAPYFRVFNPVLQGEKFDPEGAYVRRWVPELANVPAKWVHKPWAAPGLLREGYPEPIVEHDAARRRALAAYEKL